MLAGVRIIIVWVLMVAPLIVVGSWPIMAMAACNILLL